MAPWLAGADPVPGRNPNIVLIIGDDQGFGDYGFMGHPVIKTPNLDALARDSVVFTRGYVTTALCCPSLATMLTGMYPHQHGYTGNDPEKGGDRSKWIQHFQKLPQLPALLAQAGYLTMHTGKYWQGNPSVSGFTDSMGATGRHGGQALGIGRQTMKPICDFIAKAQSQSKPFFVWYAPFLPHTPHNPPERLLERYRAVGGAQAKYFAMCEWLDETCGELLKHLDDKGLRDNTVVIYIADNGWNQGVEGFRGAKLTLWEQGVRQPIMIRWPWRIAPRREEESLASNIDLAPTILTACGRWRPGRPSLSRTSLTTWRRRMPRKRHSRGVQ
jgi:arylsulfatase A-like enzyme